MKISEIVKQTEKYLKLSRVIASLEAAIERGDASRLDVWLDDRETIKLLEDAIMGVVKKHLAELKNQRDGLEI